MKLSPIGYYVTAAVCQTAGSSGAAMFALSLRKIGFDQSAPEQQGKVQGQMASALGIGFTLGPLLGGFVGKWLGSNALFLLYAVPEVLGLIFVLLGGAHRYRKTVRDTSTTLWRE